jgi:hypothetical protein
VKTRLNEPKRNNDIFSKPELQKYAMWHSKPSRSLGREHCRPQSQVSALHSAIRITPTPSLMCVKCITNYPRLCLERLRRNIIPHVEEPSGRKAQYVQWGLLHRTSRDHHYKIKTKTKLNSVAWVCERTIPTMQPPLVGEVSANFCG